MSFHAAAAPTAMLSTHTIHHVCVLAGYCWSPASDGCDFEMFGIAEEVTAQLWAQRIV